MNLKTILTAAAFAVGSSIIFGKKKFDKYKTVIDSAELKIKAIKGIRIASNDLVFDVDLDIINPTDVAIDVPGNKLVLQQLRFFTPSGKALGIADVNLSEIALPANGSRTITNIPVVLSLATIGNSFGEILQIVADPKQLKIVADVSAFGQSFTLNE